MNSPVLKHDVFNYIKNNTERIKYCDEDMEMTAKVERWELEDFHRTVVEFRQQSNYDQLLGLLVAGAKRFGEKGNQTFALNCLLEARYLVEEEESLLSSLLLLEMSEIYALNGMHAQALESSEAALKTIIQNHVLELASIYLEAYLKSVIATRDEFSMDRMQTLSSEAGFVFSKSDQARIQLVNLYIHGSYRELLDLLHNDEFTALYQQEGRWSLLDQVASYCESENVEFSKQAQKQAKFFATYYAEIDLSQKTTYRLVEWNQFSKSYARDFDKGLVLGCLTLESYFYQRPDLEMQKQVIKILSSLIPKKMEFSSDAYGIWFYFPTARSGSSLKGYLNSLLSPLVEELGTKYLLSICLPEFAQENFEETSQLVISGFYDLVAAGNEDESYQVQYAQGISPRYFSWQKVQQLLEQSHAKGDFTLKYNYFYQRQHQELHCIEFQGSLEDTSHIESQLKTTDPFVWDMINIRSELYTFQLGCKYLKETYADREGEMPNLFVKMSKKTLLNKLLTPTMMAYLEMYGIPASHIVISIDEDVLFEANDTIDILLNHWHDLGIKIGLDEYGAGSMTGSIRNLKIHYLRISSTLLQHLNVSNGSSGQIESLLSVCSSRDVKICCFNVENEGSHDIVSNFGIEVVSGGYYQTKMLFN